MIRLHAILFGITLAILSTVLVMVNPQELPSFALFGVFVLIYMMIAQLCILLLLFVRGLLGLAWRTSTIRRVGYSIGLLPTFLLLLQSVGQLTTRDVVIAVVLTLLLYVYFHRMLGGPSKADS